MQLKFKTYKVAYKTIHRKVNYLKLSLKSLNNLAKHKKY